MIGLVLLGILNSAMSDVSEVVEPGTPVVEIAKDLQFTEGPVWTKDGRLLFSDIPANKIYAWTEADGLSVFREPSDNANGHWLDLDGRLISCEHGSRTVTRTAADGSRQTLAAAYDGKRLNSPNDLVTHGSGAILFTDPPYGIQPDQAELDFNGIYRLDLDGRLTLLIDDFERPNGLAFNPDESILYVADTSRAHVKAFDVTPELTLANPRMFAEVQGPDGMRVDVEGRLYVTGRGGVHVFRADGSKVGLIETPLQPANCAFGGTDGKTLFVTARTSVYAIRTKVEGIRP